MTNSLCKKKENNSTLNTISVRYLLAGALAGAISRTATAPLDRLRVLLQIGSTSNPNANSPSSFFSRAQTFTHGIRQIYIDGGITAFWRGNGVNIIKIVPESATRFYVYEKTKEWLKSSSSSGSLSTLDRMIAGGCAGFCSQCLIYPLETIKTRMMADMSSEAIRYGKDLQYNKNLVHSHRVSAVATAQLIFRNGGFPAFFRGIWTSLIGIIPYASIDLTVYESLKSFFTKYSSQGTMSPGVHLICGALAGSLSASVVYPIGLIRTRLQAQGSTSHPDTYPRGAIDVIQRTFLKEGLRGFYKGLIPALIKVVPAVSISYITYEQAKIQLGLK